jgi:hypothetical protein
MGDVFSLEKHHPEDRVKTATPGRFNVRKTDFWHLLVLDYLSLHTLPCK